ncbi:hypothetical protein NVP1117O_01, partial [Vibrio phage 1.117.O._10N.261.45.E9]
RLHDLYQADRLDSIEVEVVVSSVFDSIERAKKSLRKEGLID